MGKVRGDVGELALTGAVRPVKGVLPAKLLALFRARRFFAIVTQNLDTNFCRCEKLDDEQAQRRYPQRTVRASASGSAVILEQTRVVSVAGRGAGARRLSTEWI